MIECLTKMTAPDDNQKELLACQSLARRLPKPQDLFAGIQGFFTVLPVNPLQFHRHGDRYLLRGAHPFCTTGLSSWPVFVNPAVSFWMAMSFGSNRARAS